MGLLEPNISDEELKQRCLVAIAKGQSKTALFYELKAEQRSIGDKRFYRMWEDCGGPLQHNTRWV